MTIIAFDIGGVLAKIDKATLLDLLHQRDVAEEQFFDADFSSLQQGLISPGDFFRKKSSLARLSVSQLTNAFARMMRISPSAKVLRRLTTPYFFASNINLPHFECFARLALPSDFAMITSLLSYKVRCLKPEPAFFRLINAIGIDASSRILLIDDKSKNLAAARQFGIMTAQCSKPDSLPNLLADLGFI